MQQSSGYSHPRYAASLAEFGSPRALPRCGGWVLERPIAGGPFRDAMGCYPLFACQDWTRLAADLDAIGGNLVSLALVADPFGAYDEALLRRCFDRVIPFKEHFVVDLRQRQDHALPSHHQRAVRAALREVAVERCCSPLEVAEQWLVLYACLTARHRIRGIAAFSPVSLARQLEVPGLVAFRALRGGATVGMTLWYLQSDVAYYHLGAYSESGYAARASYALFWFALAYFGASGAQPRWLNLGAGAGATPANSDGLTRFKRGWSTGTRTAYFCGRIFDAAAYSALADAGGIRADDYFPAYRWGEFC
jgi:hypothetical protein